MKENRALITKFVMAFFLIVVGGFCAVSNVCAKTIADSVSENDMTEADTEEAGGNVPETEWEQELSVENTAIKYRGTSGDLDWVIDTEGNLTITGAGNYQDYQDFQWQDSQTAYPQSDWRRYRYEIKTATVRVSGITSTAHMFNSCGYMTSVDLSGLDTSAVTDMAGMFQGCASLKEIDVSSMDTSLVTNMCAMFQDCGRLESLDLSMLDTGLVTQMQYMFAQCYHLSELTLTGMDTGSLQEMSSMFANCINLKSVDLSSFDTQKVISMYSLFSGCSNLEAVNVSGMETLNVTSMQNMFYNCKKLQNLDLRSFDTGAVADMGRMFAQCASLYKLDISSFRTGNVKNMREMFCGCESLTGLDLQHFDTRNAETMYGMFSNCRRLERLQVKGWDVRNVTNMEWMFSNCCCLKDLDLSSFRAIHVVNMWAMFSNCRALQTLNLSGFETNSVTNMASMFSQCESLETLDLSSFDTGRVTDMACMFGWCYNLKKLDVSSFDTGNVKDMGSMFCYCKSLEKLDFSSFTIGSATDAEGLLDKCEALTEITAPGHMAVPIAFPPYAGNDKNWYDSAGQRCTSIRVGMPAAETYHCVMQSITEEAIDIECKKEVFYTGRLIKPVTSVWCGGKELTPGTDYEVTYKNNLKPGTATFTITGKGAHKGSVEGQFQIIDRLQVSTINSLQYTYQSGSLDSFDARTKYSVYLDFFVVEHATYYEVELSDRNGKKVKTVKVKPTKKELVKKNINALSQDVCGIRIRAGRGKIHSKWSQKMYVLKQPKAQARSYQGNVQIRWEKLGGASGYEIYMGKTKDGNFTKVATTGKNTTIKSIGKFKQKKIKAGTYYYYVRAKKKVGATVYRSDISYISKVVIGK